MALVALTGEGDAASPHPWLGALWMLGAVAAWAVYTVIAKRLADADQIVVIACASAIGAVMQTPLAAPELMHAPWPSPSLQAWLAALFLGLDGGWPPGLA